MVTEVLRQSRLRDPFRDGVAGGWKVIDAAKLSADLTLEADVAIAPQSSVITWGWPTSRSSAPAPAGVPPRKS